MAHMTSWVRQYGLRDLLDDSFDLFKERASGLLLVGLLPYLLVVIYTVVMRLCVIPGNLLQNYTEEGLENMLQSGRFWGFILGAFACQTVAISVGYLAQCRLATHHALGREISLRQAFHLLAKPFWSLQVVGFIFNVFASAVAGVVGSLLVMVGAVLAIIIAATGSTDAAGYGAIVLMVLLLVLAMDAYLLTGVFFLAAPVSLAMEHTGPFVAFGKGFRMAAANFKAHFGALYLLTRVPMLFVPVIAVLSAVLFGVSEYISPTMGVVIGSLVSGLAVVVMMALMACLQALIYLDGRCRLDNFDLMLLASDIGLGEALAQATGRPALARLATASYLDYQGRLQTPAPTPTVTAVPAPGTSTTGYPNYAAPPPPLDPPAAPAGGEEGYAAPAPSTATTAEVPGATTAGAPPESTGSTGEGTDAA